MKLSLTSYPFKSPSSSSNSISLLVGEEVLEYCSLYNLVDKMQFSQFEEGNQVVAVEVSIWTGH